MAFLAPTCDRGERLMAPYDVFTNPSSSAADAIPYVVVIQSDLLDALATDPDVVIDPASNAWPVFPGGRVLLIPVH